MDTFEHGSKSLSPGPKKVDGYLLQTNTTHFVHSLVLEVLTHKPWKKNTSGTGISGDHPLSRLSLGPQICHGESDA